MILTFDQIHRYFEYRHPGQKIGTRNKASVRCAFHDDSTPSCTLFLDGGGGFHCNGCGAKGNVFQFEARFSKCTVQEAERAVAEITGAQPDSGFLAQKLGAAVAVYDYRDSGGQVLFHKRRYEPAGEGKTFRVYRPDDRGGWLFGIDAPEGLPTQRVLYNLPAVITANCVAICEGEKDCENVSQSGLFADRSSIRFATTCNFDGAWKQGEKEKWLPSYNPYLAGKYVIVFQDNDAPGAAWAQGVAAAVYPFAETVKVVQLSGLEPKGDVSDWLQTHTAAELEKEIKRTPKWRPIEVNADRSMFQDAVEFASEAPARVDWLVENVIPAAGNGIICGDPKASKSFHAVDLAMSLACGESWLGHKVLRRIRTALVSREDSPGLTQRRIGRLLCGNERYGLQLQSWMLVNTRRHQADFKVTTEEHLARLIAELKRFQVELCVLDVFRLLHDSEENDNTEVPLVLQKINRIQTECNCAVALVHHINKVSADNIFKGIRGASAIHGWMEWGIGISVVNPEEEDKAKYIRKLEFENKEGVAPAIYSQICEGDTATIRIKRVERPENAQRKTRRVADVLSMGAQR